MTDNVYQQAVDLTNRVFQVTAGLDLPRGNHWLTVVTVFLTQANERLASIRVLLDRDHSDSAGILTRSLFELAVNLAYIAKNVKERLHQYLKHGGFPLTRKEAEEQQKELQKELQEDRQPEVKDVIPGKAWKPLRDMCTDLGSDWLKEYETFYRYVSVPTHAGSFTLGKNYLQLLEQQPPLERQKAIFLTTALFFHLRVAELAATVFPQQIKLETVKNMRAECQELGQSL